MKIITQNICPPIPVRSCDWVAYFDAHDEDGPRGYGRTERQAISDLFDNAEVDDLADWFGIEARKFGNGPEDHYWVASTDNGSSVSSPWRDCAIASLAYELARDAQ